MINSIELFSGTGGLALGLQLSGFKHEALYEWDKDSCDNLRHNIQNGYPAAKDWKVFQDDVRAVHFDGYADSIQLVAGGLPASPFPSAESIGRIMTSVICFPKRSGPSAK